MYPGIIDACKKERGGWSYTCNSKGDAAIAALPAGLLKQPFRSHDSVMVGKYRSDVNTTDVVLMMYIILLYAFFVAWIHKYLDAHVIP